MRCTKCGHSEDDDWKFEPFGEPVISNIAFNMPGSVYIFDGVEWTDVSRKPKPTLWQRLKTWWRAW